MQSAPRVASNKGPRGTERARALLDVTIKCARDRVISRTTAANRLNLSPNLCSLKSEINLESGPSGCRSFVSFFRENELPGASSAPLHFSDTDILSAGVRGPSLTAARLQDPPPPSIDTIRARRACERRTARLWQGEGARIMTLQRRRARKSRELIRKYHRISRRGRPAPSELEQHERRSAREGG